MALLLATLATPAVAAGPGPEVVTSAGPGATAGDYIVTLKPGAPVPARITSAARTLAADHGGTVQEVYSSALQGFSAKGLSAAEARELANDPAVDRVYEDSPVELTAVQQDAPIGLDRIDQGDNRYDDTYTYADATTGAGVNVYVVDTGINLDHQEFTGRVDGVIPVPHYPADPGAPVPPEGMDFCGHGTQVAGIIGGTKYGVAKRVSLHAVANGCGFVSSSDLIYSIDWVTKNAKRPAVVNLSQGKKLGDDSLDYDVLDKAVAGSIATGLTWVIAAGNEGEDVSRFTPARVPAAITVGAADEMDRRESYSNYGPGIDIFAPGDSIPSAYMGAPDATRTDSGTSLAAPHVTGVAAKYLQVNPDAGPEDVRRALLADALGVVQDPGPGSTSKLLYSPPDPRPRGALEAVTRTTVRGWADDRSCPDPIQVELSSKAPSDPSFTPLALVTADKPAGGYGRHGFAYEHSLPAGTLVSAKARGVNGGCNPDQSTTSFDLRNVPEGAGPPLEGGRVFIPIGRQAGATTGIQVRNSASAAVTARLDYFNEDGTIAGTSTLPVPANGSATSVDKGPTGDWTGAVVVNGLDGADKLSAVVNHVINGRASSSSGFVTGSRTVQLPLLMRAHYGYSTRYAVQNTGAAVTEVTATYSYDLPGQNVKATEKVTLEPGAAHVFSQADAPGPPPGSLFSAQLSSTAAEVAVTVLQESETAALEYAGFMPWDQSTDLAATLVMAGNYGAYTGVQVQNVGTRPADISITYGPNTAGSYDSNESPNGRCDPKVPRIVYDVQPGASATFLQTAAGDPQFGKCTYIGAAMITSSGQPVVAALNQIAPDTASAYEARPADLLTSTVRLPLIQVNNFGSSGGIQLASFGPDPVSATITFEHNSAPPKTQEAQDESCPAPPDPIPDIALNQLGTRTVLLPRETPRAADCAYVGSVQITSTGSRARLAILANQVSAEGSDRMGTYTAP